MEVLSRNRLEEPSPPPLPPKNAHLEGVLNSEALANSNVIIEKKGRGLSSAGLTTTSSTSSPTVIASLRGPFHYRRRSAGLLFGINEIELPAPDTVKETRKIFENGAPRPAGGMVKSKSTSNIYGQRLKSCSSPVRKTTRQNSQPKLNLVTKPALPAKPDKVDLKKKQPAARALDTKVPPTKAPPAVAKPVKSDWHQASKNESTEIEEGIKIVSKDSINKIRSSGESFSFNFNKKEEQPSKPAYLPKAKNESDKVPIGVIKPISRTAKETTTSTQNNKIVEQKQASPPPPPPPTKSNSLQLQKPTLKQPKEHPPPVPQQRAESPTTTLNNLINLTKQTKNAEKERKKEVILPDKPSILKSNLKSHKVVTFAQDLESKTSKDNNAADEGIDDSVTELDMKCNFRDSWKKNNETKNTIVFNFLNSQKDVTHIENDGLDLSTRRKKKQHLQQMAKVSRSTNPFGKNRDFIIIVL